jgi:hypothetical protein
MVAWKQAIHTEFRWKLLLECDDFDNDGVDRPEMVKKKKVMVL